MTDPEDSRFALVVTGVVVAGMMAGLVATVAELAPDHRFAVVVTFAWLVLMLPIHELGHAVVARSMGARIERLSLGYGPVLLDRSMFDVRLVVRAFPVQGFVRIDGMNRLSRGAIAFVYAAGVGTEALVAVLATLVASPERLFVGGGTAPVVVAEAAWLVVAWSAVANLVPRVATTEPNGEGGETNDGLMILRALAGR